MRFTIIEKLLTLVPTLCLGLMASAWSADIPLKKGDVPTAVLATMEKAAGVNVLYDYEKETMKDGTVVFAANFKDQAGKEMEVEVKPGGILISVAAE